MDLGLKGRTAIVCGASAGLGLASAEALAEEGANVAMFARRREQLEQQADRIGALAVRGDVTNAADLQRLVDLTVQAFGGIDIVVWNSGGPPPGPAAEITDDRLEMAFELLLLPAVRLIRLCLPHLEASAAGRIVCITSVAVKEPVPHLSLSNTIRPAVTGWAKSLARELGAEGDHRQLRRAGPDRHPAHDRALRRGRPARGRAGPDPRRPPGQATRARRPRLLPRLGPGLLHHGHDDPGRRRQHSRAALRIFTAGRLLAAGGVLLLVVAALWVLPSSEYIFLPDRAHPVGPLVTVQGGHNPTRGGVYFVDVIVRKATILERLFGGLHNGADLFPASEIDPPGIEQRAAQHDRPGGHAALAADRRRSRAESARAQGRGASDRRR